MIIDDWRASGVTVAFGLPDCKNDIYCSCAEIGVARRSAVSNGVTRMPEMPDKAVRIDPVD
jgi:hypothetical protein